MLRKCFTSGRQAIRLHTGRPDACGIELDCFAICPCKHSYLFPRRLAALSPWLRVLHRLLVPPVVSRFKSRATSATGMWRSLTQRILRTLLARPLRLLTIMDLFCSGLAFFNSSWSSSATLHRVSDIALTVCHRHGREVIHKLACFEWRRKLCGQNVVHAFQDAVELFPGNNPPRCHWWAACFALPSLLHG